MNLIHILANSFGPEAFPLQVTKVSWCLVMPRRQRLFFFFFFTGDGRGGTGRDQA